MFKIARFFAAVLYVTVCSLSALAQAGPARLISAKFVSADGGFTIDLPNTTDDNIRPIGSISAGAGTFTWRVPEGNFTVGFVEGISVLPADGFRALNDLAAAAEKAQIKNGARIADRCEFSFDGSPGVELKTERAGGIKGVIRFILAGQKLYVLTAEWPTAATSEADVRKILDSFELNDTRALIA